MKEHFDAAIIGDGISGACAAIRLAKNGAQVLVLEADEFPRHKVCGEFLSLESKKVLRVWVCWKKFAIPVRREFLNRKS